MKLLEDGCDAVDEEGVRVRTRAGGFWTSGRETKEEGVTVVQVRSNKAVNEDGSGTRGKGGAEAVDVAQVEISRPSDVINVGLER